jgi:predicted TIM-barrel fold metal-dependent hydrolase
MEIIDAHVHIGDLYHLMSDYSNGEASAPPPLDPDADIASRLRAMDAFGVSWAIVQPSHGYLRADGIRDTMRINDEVADYRRRCPERFPIALGTVEPLHGERSLKELERIKHELKLNGVSWHHRMSGVMIDSPWMWRILRKMRELELVPVIHTMAESNFEAAWQLQRIAKAMPDTGFLAMDAFYGYARGQQVFNTASETPNIVWDIGGPVNWLSLTQWVKHNGSKTICFSGAASYPIPPGVTPSKPRLLEEIEQADISDEQRADILSRNLRRLFKLPPKPTRTS